ncbi:MAG: dTDP-4-dehydrorhamnose reductase [Burkholderiaceae bacterium]|nr:dTDP-4-dehydrorhamnose reductase [Burkholderiaceae bacterium]
MKLLLLGASGQVGWELMRSLQPLGEIIAPRRSQVDLSRPATLRAVVESAVPTVIVNAAAYTAVDRAERERGSAYAANAAAPAILAEAARRSAALLVHYSTDYVFDGSGEAPRDETAEAGPLNVYGHSKLAGEQAISASDADWLVLRTSWVYAARAANFLRTMLRLGAEQSCLRVVSDQIGAPTPARLIADATAQVVAHALRARNEGRFASSLLHLCAGGQTSWHGFAQAIFEGWRARHGAASLKVNRVEPIPSADFPLPATRPLNSRLDCSRLEMLHGIRLPDWRVGLGLVLDELPATRPAAAPAGDRPDDRTFLRSSR